MTQETFTKEQFWAELAALGETEVRTRIATKRYGHGNYKLPLAEEWLRSIDQERATSAARRIEASNDEQICIARSAKNAAWIAAIAAIVAAIAAVIAIYPSLNS